MIVVLVRTDTWKRNSKLMLKELDQNDASVPKSAANYYSKITPLAYNQGFLGWFGMVKRILLSLISIGKPMVRQPKSMADMRVWANKSTA